MERLYLTTLLLLYYFSALGQVIFERLPKDLQLYPRDANNQATVVISGTITTAGYTKISTRMLREGQLTKVFSQTIAPAAAGTAFSFSAVINAERAEYGFQVFLHKGIDSTRVADRKRIVCGDVFIIHGQSNALASVGLNEYYSSGFDDKYLRNCSYRYGSLNIPDEMSWYPAKEPHASVGGFGLTLQRLILQNYGIPTVVLNGAFGGTGITALSARDPNNHANLSTLYGRLLFRAQWAGVNKKVKAIIWKQGEDEAGNGPIGYDEKFKTLYNQLQEDYSGARLYVSQINILADRVEEAAALRDFQRRSEYLFKNLETMATVGTRDYDGIHYAPRGHQQMAYEQFRQIARDFYGAKDTLQINSPDIKKAYYNLRKDSITMVFDEGMQMVYKADTSTYSFATGELLKRRELKEFFYLDEKAGSVISGSANGNRIVLSLKQPSSAKRLRYLPAYFSDAKSAFYDGPTLRNVRGMRAFSFDGVPIAESIAAVTTLAAKSLSADQVQLTWTTPVTAQTQVLERADRTPDYYKPIASLSATTSMFIDRSLPNPVGTYYYRLRAFSDVSESAYSNVAKVELLLLGNEPIAPLVRVYPNPLSADRRLNFEADRMTFTKIAVRDLLGRLVKSWWGTAYNLVSIALDGLGTGLYVADVQTADGQTLRQKVMIR